MATGWPQVYTDQLVDYKLMTDHKIDQKNWLVMTDYNID